MTLRILADDSLCLAIRANERELTGAPVWIKVRMASSRILRSRPDGSGFCISRLIYRLAAYKPSSRLRAYRKTRRRLMPRQARGYCSAMVAKPVSLNSLRFSLVGPGKVGSSLAHWLVSLGAGLSQVASRNPDAASRLTETLGGHPTELAQMTSSEDDLLLVAVSDPVLQEVALALAERQQASVVLHTSGRTEGGVLSPLRQNGSAIGSLHPLKTFPNVILDPTEAAGTVFGIDGDDKAQSMARQIASGLAGVATVVPPATRSQYHLLATMAAGGVVTLLASAAELAKTVGLAPEIVAGYLSLASDAVRSAATSETIARAITGPIARGDMRGFQDQIDEIRSLDPDMADFLEALARQTDRHCRGLEAGGPELPRP